MSLEKQLQALSEPGLIRACDHIIDRVILKEEDKAVHQRLGERYPILAMLTAYIFYRYEESLKENTGQAFANGAARMAIALSEYAETVSLEDLYAETAEEEPAERSFREELLAINAPALASYYIDNVHVRSQDETAEEYMIRNLDEKYDSLTDLAFYIAESYGRIRDEGGTTLEASFKGNTRSAFYAGSLILAATLAEYADRESFYTAQA